MQSRVTANARTRGLLNLRPNISLPEHAGFPPSSRFPSTKEDRFSREKPLPRALPIFRPRSFLSIVILSLSLSFFRVARYPPSLSRLTSNIRVITARLCVCVSPLFCSRGDPNHYRTPCWKLKKLVSETDIRKFRASLYFIIIYIYILYRSREGGLYRCLRDIISLSFGNEGKQF